MLDWLENRYHNKTAASAGGGMSGMYGRQRSTAEIMHESDSIWSEIVRRHFDDNAQDIIATVQRWVDEPVVQPAQRAMFGGVPAMPLNPYGTVNPYASGNPYGTVNSYGVPNPYGAPNPYNHAPNMYSVAGAGQRLGAAGPLPTPAVARPGPSQALGTPTGQGQGGKTLSGKTAEVSGRDLVAMLRKAIATLKASQARNPYAATY